jgi:hypothetical protein
MKAAPDRMTLDALVAGLEEQGDVEAWDWLLTSPGSANTWSEALERRLRIERYAQALIAHPWIAQAQSVLHALVRSRPRMSEGAIEAVLGGELLLADLGPNEPAPTRLVEAAWGRIEAVEVPVGTTVELRWVGEQQEPLRFFYKTPTSEGEMQEGLWKLEVGEAPVLLLACRGVEGDTTPSNALTSARGTVGVLLLEQSPGDADTRP